MLSHKQLMRHLRNDHNIKIKSNQSQALRNIGYYHGYKGYRFIRGSNNKINFNSFDEVLAINKFDTELKALLYPKIMFIENALKSYVIESVLKDSKSEYLDDIFERSLTDFKNSSPGSKSQKDKIKMRIKLKNSINTSLLRDYTNNKLIVNHFYGKNRSMPIWAIFESLSFGDLAKFFDCTNSNVKLYVSKILHLPSNLDKDGELIKGIIYMLVDLRNAIAHNAAIFDGRFQTGKANNLVVKCIEQEINIKNLNFQNIDAFILLITYLLKKMKVSKSECKKFITSFSKINDELRNKISTSIYNQILGTQAKTNIEQTLIFIKK